LIDAILKGIYDKFSATNDFKTAINGRLYAYEAPQGAIYPYCIFEQISGFPDWDFTDNQEDVLIQLTLVDNSDSVATIADAETKMYTLFDGASLTISGYDHIKIDRESNVLLKASPALDDKNSLWNVIATYRIYAEKT